MQDQPIAALLDRDLLSVLGLAGHRLELTTTDLASPLVFAQLVPLLNDRQMLLRMRPMTWLRRPSPLGGAWFPLRGEQTLQRCGGEAELDLRYRLAAETGNLEALIANHPLQALDLAIEQSDHVPQPLGIAEPIELDHATESITTTRCFILHTRNNRSLGINHRRRQGPPTHLTATFCKERQFRR